ncbi:MAG: hypothetical protein K5857_10565 [Lachnospiraceae bacterium]|nr:hypothetical protein [Lachnospiraceae bacterium]
MFTMAVILFFAVFARYIYFVWNSDLDSVQSIVCLMILPVAILLLLSEGPVLPAMFLIVLAGILSFSKSALGRRV